jgi:transcriptional regulator with XRE-family HTH domain
MTAEWFGSRLRELREKAGLTQTQLADVAGVRRGAIARWERGDREPGWSNILALANALGVSCEAFTVEPAEQLPAKPGRPRKAVEAGQVEAEKPGKGKPTKKQRGK